MNSAQCKVLMENLPLVQALAEGRDLYFAAFDCNGRFIEWRRTSKILLGPLAEGHYVLKPRYQCIKGSKPKAIPYPHQAERKLKRR